MQIQHANMSETFLDWRYMFSSNHFNPTFRTNFPKEELELYQQAIVFEDNLWIETEAFYGNNIPLPSHHSFHSYPNKDCSRFWKIFDLLKKRKEEGNRYWMWLDEFEIYPVYSYQWEQQQNQKKMKNILILALFFMFSLSSFASSIKIATNPVTEKKERKEVFNTSIEKTISIVIASENEIYLYKIENRQEIQGNYFNTFKINPEKFIFLNRKEIKKDISKIKYKSDFRKSNSKDNIIKNYIAADTKETPLLEQEIVQKE